MRSIEPGAQLLKQAMGVALKGEPETIFRWAEVTSLSPLRVQLEGGSEPLSLTPDTLAPVRVGDRVRVEMSRTSGSARRVIVHGSGRAVTEVNVGQIHPYYTVGRPLVTWDGGATYEGPYSTLHQWQPRGGDWVTRIPAVGAIGGYVVAPYWSLNADSYYPRWHLLTLLNGWVNYAGGYSTAAVTKTGSGIVKVRGLIASGTVAGGTTIAVLPEGFRPEGKIIIAAQCSGIVAGSIDILPTGEIVSRVTVAAWTSLDNISFPAADVAGTEDFIVQTPLNSFQHYVDAIGNGWPKMSHWMDEDGIIWEHGLGYRSTAPGATTVVFDSASPYQTGARLIQHRRGTSNGGLLMAYKTETGLTQWGLGSAVNYFSLDGMPYVGDTASHTWTPFSMINGWVNYNAASYASASWMKTAGHHVHLAGLIKSGVTTSGTIIAGLPAGARPAVGTLIFATLSNGATARVDVEPNGNIIAREGTSATWLSLDGINFVAEQ